MIGNKLQIAFAPPAVAGQGAITAALLAEVMSTGQTANFEPQSLLAAARNRLYLDTFGQNVVSMFGSLPVGLELVRPTLRSELIERLWERTKSLCISEFSKSLATEQKLLSSMGTSVNGLRSTKFSDNDTFTLVEVSHQLDDRSNCSFGRPELPTSPPIKPAEKAKPSGYDSDKKRTPDLSQPRPKPAPDKSEESKNPRGQKNKHDDDDDNAPSTKRRPSETKPEPKPAPDRRPQAEARTQSEPKPSPAKGKGPVNIPF